MKCVLAAVEESGETVKWGCVLVCMCDVEASFAGEVESSQCYGFSGRGVRVGFFVPVTCVAFLFVFVG